MFIKKFYSAIWILTLGMALGITTTSCYRSSDQMWDDSRSAGRHMSRGLRTMGGKHGDSRAVQSREEFMAVDNGMYYYNDNYNEPYADFVPLCDQPYECEIAMADYASRQPYATPGDPGSPIPGINAFQDPSMNPTWGAIFRNVHFEYNSNLVKGQDNLNTIRSISNYMKRNPNVYVFVEGHCDERGPEAYNLALGSRRSNAVRNLLVQEGVNPDNIFTISYGKERPIFYDQTDESHSQNRRAEFKIYQR